MMANVIDATDIGWGSDVAQRRGGTRALVIHHTAGRTSPANLVPGMKKNQVSIHYIIDRDGTIHQMMNADGRASHVNSDYRTNRHGDLVNDSTIGVEIVADNDADVLPEQILAAEHLAFDVLGLRPEQVVGHGMINFHRQLNEGGKVADYVSRTRSGIVPPPVHQVGKNDGRTFAEIAAGYGLSPEEFQILNQDITALNSQPPWGAIYNTEPPPAAIERPNLAAEHLEQRYRHKPLPSWFPAAQPVDGELQEALNEFAGQEARHRAIAEYGAQADRVDMPVEGSVLVQNGQSLSDIARQHGLTLRQLIERNPRLNDIDIIHPGTTINLLP